MLDAYLIHLLIIICIYIILAVSLNLVIGNTGYLNLSHLALFGIGAYVSVLLNMNGVPFIFSFIIAGLAAAFCGFLLILATKNLKGDYYALATLGFSFVMFSLATNLKITRGPMGIPGIPRPEIFGYVFQSNTSFLILTAAVVFITIFFIYSLVKSPFGRLVGAMRDDEMNLKVLGKNTNKLKYKVIAISGFFAGIVGSLDAHYISFINPALLSIQGLIFVLTIVIIGGIASIEGSIIAAFILVLLPEALKFFSLPTEVLGPVRQIIYALALILIIMYKPKGLFGRIDLE
ncbi:Branched-chain amino acid transport system / permease component [uncultured archaeon]|nr:Branched-chain amino acid transport system / permease component [uncultured archaeon]